MMELQQTIADIIERQYGVTTEVVLSRPEPQFGDAATNIAMQITKQAGRSPRDIAQSVAHELQEDTSVKEVSIAGPGFLNIRLTDQALLAMFESGPAMLSEYAGKTVVIETNNPNPFKDLHIGHAYNCIVADTIANLLDAGRADVHRVSYHGDVGLHVGKSMWAILCYIDNDPTKLDKVVVEDRPSFLSARYIEGAAAYDDDPSAQAEIKALAKESFSLHQEPYRTVYETCKTWSFAYIDQTVERLGSQPTEKKYLERDADVVGVATVKKHIGDVFSESDGAVVFAGEAFGLHTRVFLTKEGNGLYESRDLGLMQLKAQDYHPVKSFIVTGNEQKEYFRVVMKAAELCLPELKDSTVNIPTGIVKLTTGRMKSRTGEVLNIQWLFEQLQNALVARGGKADDHGTVVGALRYSMLRVRIGGDVVFDVDTALSLDGNSGPYLQYAHARARSILQKVTPGDATLSGDLDTYERALARKLGEYREVQQKAVTELLPHLICTYLYELAQEFNRFYEQARVVGDEREAIRSQLVGQYADILKDGLTLLGINAPETL